MSRLKLRLRANTWYAVGTINKITIKKSSGFNEPDKEAANLWMLQFELDLLKQKGQEFKLDNKPFKTLVKQYQDATPDLSYREINAMSICLRYLGAESVISVRTNLDNYIKTRHKNSKDNSIDRDVRRIKAVVTFGHQLKLCGKFEYHFECDDDARFTFLEPDLRDAYINAFPDEYKDFVTLLNFQGLRFSQAANLTADNIQGDFLVVETKKGQKRRIKNGQRTELKSKVRLLGMHPRVKIILSSRVDIIGSKECLFPEIEYQKYRRVHVLVCEKLGITDYRIHDNRKTFATGLSQIAGANDREAASALGQSTTRNVYRYSMMKDALKVISKLE